MRNLEMENPSAAATATGVESEILVTSDLSYRIKREWANAAWYALDQCDPSDVHHIASTFLAELETGGPIMGDLLGTATADALFWADCAPVHELVAYGAAALDRLKVVKLGLTVRKQLFVSLWGTFEPEQRRAFLSRVDAAGAWLGKEVKHEHG